MIRASILGEQTAENDSQLLLNNFIETPEYRSVIETKIVQLSLDVEVLERVQCLQNWQTNGVLRKQQTLLPLRLKIIKPLGLEGYLKILKLNIHMSGL